MRGDSIGRLFWERYSDPSKFYITLDFHSGNKIFEIHNLKRQAGQANVTCQSQPSEAAAGESLSLKGKVCFAGGFSLLTLE